MLIQAHLKERLPLPRLAAAGTDPYSWKNAISRGAASATVQKPTHFQPSLLPEVAKSFLGPSMNYKMCGYGT